MLEAFAANLLQRFATTTVPSVLEAFRCELAATHMSCPDCFRGFLHSGEPRGRDETLAGVQCYVSSPPGGSTATAPIILFLSDVFGHTFGEPRARLLRLPLLRAPSLLNSTAPPSPSSQRAAACRHVRRGRLPRGHP